MPRGKSNDGISEVVVGTLDIGGVETLLVGDRPLILNRPAEKARRELFLPPQDRGRRKLEGTLKHVPYEEFRGAAHMDPDPKNETLLCFPSSGIKKAMATAALYMQGATKTDIGRLTWIERELTPIWGIPEIFTTLVKMPDMKRTPDMRTRCIVREWCAIVRFSYISPCLNSTSVLSLLNAGGLVAGIGDGRQEKGTFNYGQFHILPLKEIKKVAHIMKYGRKQQLAAMDNPGFYNQETRDLIEWYQGEIKRRGLKEPAPEHVVSRFEHRGSMQRLNGVLTKHQDSRELVVED